MLTLNWIRDRISAVLQSLETKLGTLHWCHDLKANTKFGYSASYRSRDLKNGYFRLRQQSNTGSGNGMCSGIFLIERWENPSLFLWFHLVTPVLQKLHNSSLSWDPNYVAFLNKAPLNTNLFPNQERNQNYVILAQLANWTICIFTTITCEMLLNPCWRHKCLYDSLIMFHKSSSKFILSWELHKKHSPLDKQSQHSSSIPLLLQVHCLAWVSSTFHCTKWAPTTPNI